MLWEMGEFLPVGLMLKEMVTKPLFLIKPRDTWVLKGRRRDRENLMRAVWVSSYMNSRNLFPTSASVRVRHSL